ncbi:hypothetical protein MSG28_004491 [Choristoneura fumiferana]|uniref:Uncharacterized protein n=1 Tax=Choristoneura fumiferana TaxID=7141 RepID=A0ACC0K6B6_CHOFU|nr:hypothetical protein MSG28_004491 [Choristoneura fumiferana]
MSRIITTAEVKKHNHKDSVWMIIHNDVYDVTNFLDEHPGGEETLLDSAGKEASQDFEDGADEEIQDWNIASRGAQPSTNTAIACSEMAKNATNAPQEAVSASQLVFRPPKRTRPGVRLTAVPKGLNKNHLRQESALTRNRPAT